MSPQLITHKRGLFEVAMSYYSATLKEDIVQKVLLTDGRPLNQIAREAGISASTVRYWVTCHRKKSGESPLSEQEKRPKDWSAEERVLAVIETASLDEEQKNIWCRTHGVYKHHLEQWKKDAVSGTALLAAQGRVRQDPKLQKKVRSLEKELTRKEKALAEASALLLLKKKAHSIWGDSEED
jgi:transposase-like protein